MSEYDTAIAAVEEEILKLTATLRVLRGYAQEPDVLEVRHVPTNEEAVKAILRDAYPQYLGVSRIGECGPTIGGRPLNKDSVRWVLARGVKWGEIEKVRQNGRVSYRMSEGA